MLAMSQTDLEAHSDEAWSYFEKVKAVREFQKLEDWEMSISYYGYDDTERCPCCDLELVEGGSCPECGQTFL